MLLFATRPEEVAALRQWAEARIPHLYGGSLPECQIAGVVRHGRLSAAVAFYDYIQYPDGPTLRVSVAAESVQWARPHVIAAIYQYAFQQAGAFMLEAATPAANTATLRLLERIGFKQWGIRPHAYGRKKHQAQFYLTADMWRRSKYFCEV